MKLCLQPSLNESSTLLRVLTPLVKLYTGKLAVDVASEGIADAPLLVLYNDHRCHQGSSVLGGRGISRTPDFRACYGMPKCSQYG